MSTAIEIERIQNNAQKVFDELLKGNGTGRSLVLRNPEAALIALSKGKEAVGLTTFGASNALEIILEAYSDPKQAQQALDDHLTTEQQAELAGGRGDLPSHALIIANPEVLHLIILKAVEQTIPEEQDHEESTETHERTALFTHARSSHLYAIAQVMKDNPAYQEVLDREVGDATLRMHLLFGIWCMGGSPRNLEDLTSDLFIAVDLDPEDERDRLREVLSDHQERRLDPEQLHLPPRSLPPQEVEIGDEASSADGLRQIKSHEEQTRAQETEEIEESDLDLG